MQRNATLDFARLLAAFGIVWFHAGAAGARFGYAGLAFFVILIALLTTPAALRLSFPAFVRNRATRLLLPWAIASGFYGTLKLGDILAGSALLETEFTPSMLLTGPAIHLWFLPFAFVVSLCLYPTAHALMRCPQVVRDPLALGAGISVLIVLALQPASPLPAPLAQWVFALPAVLFGLCLMIGGAQPMRLLAMTGAIACVGYAAGWTNGLPQLVLAGLALVLCFAFPLPASRTSAMAARLAMWVYLVHPAVGSVMQRTTDIPHGSVWFATLMLAGALAVSLICDGMIRWAGKRQAGDAQTAQINA